MVSEEARQTVLEFNTTLCHSLSMFQTATELNVPGIKAEMT